MNSLISTQVAFILEARRGFDANARAFAHVLVSYGLLCDAEAANRPGASATPEKRKKNKGAFEATLDDPADDHHKKKKKKKKHHRRFA